MWTRRVWPLTVIALVWTFARKVRLVLGALRSQRPVCWWRIFRPKVVPLPQKSHIVGMAGLS